jgi:hypothetical protein
LCNVEYGCGESVDRSVFQLYYPMFKTYTEDMVTKRSKQRPKLEINTDGLKPFVNYRNPQDDKIASAIQEAVKRLKA